MEAWWRSAEPRPRINHQIAGKLGRKFRWPRTDKGDTEPVRYSVTWATKRRTHWINFRTTGVLSRLLAHLSRGRGPERMVRALVCATVLGVVVSKGVG